MTSRVVAIDGPAASGKSSTAAAVAARLGWMHIDSGALYRAVTWVAVDEHVDGAAAVLAAAERRHLRLEQLGANIAVAIDGAGDVESAIRSPAVDARVSEVAAMPSVREWVNRQLRASLQSLPGAVIDGRDIGTVVVPDAALKVYLVASAQVRAERRLRQRDVPIDAGVLARETAALSARDRLDATRAAAPLRQAGDAVVLDTSGLTFDDQVERIVTLAREAARRSDL